MTGPGAGYDVEPAAVRDVGTSISGATAPLGVAADGATEAPNAGIATGDVVDYLQALSEALRDLTQAVEATGQQVVEAVDTYERDDQGAAGDVRTVEFPAGPP